MCRIYRLALLARPLMSGLFGLELTDSEGAYNPRRAQPSTPPNPAPERFVNSMLFGGAIQPLGRAPYVTEPPKASSITLA